MLNTIRDLLYKPDQAHWTPQQKEQELHMRKFLDLMENSLIFGATLASGMYLAREVGALKNIKKIKITLAGVIATVVAGNVIAIKHRALSQLQEVYAQEQKMAEKDRPVSTWSTQYKIDTIQWLDKYAQRVNRIAAALMIVAICRWARPFGYYDHYHA